MANWTGSLGISIFTFLIGIGALLSVLFNEITFVFSCAGIALFVLLFFAGIYYIWSTKYLMDNGNPLGLPKCIDDLTMICVVAGVIFMFLANMPK